jgi:hypothetical protein
VVSSDVDTTALVVTLGVPLLCAEQSLLLYLQHLPRAFAVAVAVALVEPLLYEEQSVLLIAC